MATSSFDNTITPDAAGDLLRTAQAAGIALDRHSLADIWDTGTTPEEERSIYLAECELSAGD